MGARLRPRTGFYNEFDVRLLDDILGEDGFERFLDAVRFPEELIEHEVRELVKEGEERSHEELRELAIENLYDALGYWLIYYEPEIVDVSVAIEVGLIPFYVGEHFFLALGGCGMDLSPRLDAYQALTDHTIDPSSKFFSDAPYFAYVVGHDVYLRVCRALGINPLEGKLACKDCASYKDGYCVRWKKEEGR